MKKMLVIAVAGALIAPAAMADTTLYGKLSVSAGSVKTEATVGGVTAENKATPVESHASRVGVKGSTALDNGLEATYGLEFGLDVDGDNGSSTSSTTGLTSRNTFVGLKGGFGEVRVGKHDTPHKLSTAGLDNFPDTYADSGNFILERRADNVVAYINKFGPIGVAAAHATATDAGLADGLAGDPEAISVMANYSNGGLYAGLGHESVQSVDKDTKLGLGYSAEAGHKINLVLEQNDRKDPTFADSKAALLGGQYKLGNTALKAQYGQRKYDDVGTVMDAKETIASVGVDYSLGKKTSVYGLYNVIKDEDTTAGVASEAKQTSAVVGLQTEF